MQGAQVVDHLRGEAGRYGEIQGGAGKMQARWEMQRTCRARLRDEVGVGQRDVWPSPLQLDDGRERRLLDGRHAALGEHRERAERGHGVVGRRGALRAHHQLHLVEHHVLEGDGGPVEDGGLLGDDGELDEGVDAALAPDQRGGHLGHLRERRQPAGGRDLALLVLGAAEADEDLEVGRLGLGEPLDDALVRVGVRVRVRARLRLRLRLRLRVRALPRPRRGWRGTRAPRAAPTGCRT